MIESLSVLDWGPGNEPVGQVFEETLAHLSALDRQLLLFCATSSLAAVRWLVHLGASVDCCDANGSTCLHVACRSGALVVVCELLQRAQLLDAVDAASWTPLHIAAHMGRREAAVRLLRARASPQWRNARNQTPLDLCMDIGTLEVLRDSGQVARDGGGQLEGLVHTEAWQAAQHSDDGQPFVVEEDTVGTPLRAEPECFFVNPSPVIRATTPFRKALLHVAAIIFNLRPSHGLAFAVVTGIVDSYTGAMRIFLQQGGACRVKLGSFLGEAFSLCTLIRFSVFDAMPLLNTGVLSALCRAFSVFQLPEDLQKIDRLVRGLAHVWWRKHKSHAESLEAGRLNDAGSSRRTIQKPDAGGEDPESPDDEPEFVGLELKQYLASSEAFCQLMLSTVLLHWQVHDNGSGPGKPLDFNEWVQLNRGIELGGTDIPEHVQRRVYRVVCRGLRRELALTSAGRPSPERVSPPTSPTVLESRALAGGLQAAAKMGPPVARTGVGMMATSGNDFAQFPSVQGMSSPSRTPLGLTCVASYEAWAYIFDGALACPEELFQQGKCECTALASPGGMFSSANPLPGTPTSPQDFGASSPSASGQVLMSISSIFLFFSLGTSIAPYSFTDARQLHVDSLCSTSGVISLTGMPPKNAPNSVVPITVVHFLPDGRWQEVLVPKLSFQVDSPEEFTQGLVQCPANQFVAI